MTDHLDSETTVKVELTSSGASLSAKSRVVAAVDRLGGALVDNLNSRIEGNTAKQRAKSRGEVALLENIVEYGIKELGANPDQAERAFRQHFRKVIVAQENKDEVLRHAIEDLRERPPLSDTPGSISEDFFQRFESFSEAASNDSIRQVFGKILAGEIRKPGLVPPSALHLVSMLDEETAQLIDRVLPFTNRHGMCFIEFVTPQLKTSEIATLELSGFFSAEKNHTMDFLDGLNIRQIGDDRGIVIYGDKDLSFSIGCAILSPAGKAIVQIINKTFDSVEFTRRLMQKGASGCSIGKFSIEGDRWIVSDAYPVATN